MPQDWQQDLREDERHVEIQVQHLMPDPDVVVLDWRALAENAGVMQQAVQATPGLTDPLGDFEVIAGLCSSQIQHRNGWLGKAPCRDFVVHRFELLLRAAEQDHRGAVPGAGDGRCSSKSVTSTGDQNYAVTELVWLCHVGAARCG